MFGWDSEATARASVSNRPRATASLRQRVGNDLDRDLALQSRIAGAIHLAHAPCTEQTDDFVCANSTSGLGRHVVRHYRCERSASIQAPRAISPAHIAQSQRYGWHATRRLSRRSGWDCSLQRLSGLRRSRHLRWQPSHDALSASESSMILS